MKTEGRNPTLCRAFVKTAKEILANYPNIRHEWSIDDDNDHCILDIPRQSETGFNITIETFPSEIIVSADGPHHHFDDVKDIKATVDNVLGLVRDLLSPAMRIREIVSNGRPYKWHLESQQHGQWIIENTTGLFSIFALLGKKSERIYQNNILPIRNQDI